MRPKEYIIYMATNATNGNRYVGATSCGLKVRKNKHFQDAMAERRGCRIFNAAIRKYGKVAFKWEVIARAKSFDDLMREEIRIIGELKPEYNITRGGKGIVGVPRTAEWMAKTSRSLKGRKPSQSCYDANTHEYHFKSITCVNDGRFFESIKAAATFYGIRRKSISEVLSERTLSCGTARYSFVYSDRALTTIECLAAIEQISEKRTVGVSNRIKSRCRAVVCLTDDARYESARSAAKRYGIAPARVMQLCQLGGTTLSGLSFKYADQECAPQKRVRTDGEKATHKRLVLEALARGQRKIKKPVMLVETGKVFESIAEAATALSLNDKCLYDAIAHGRKYRGYTFARAA